MGFGEVAYGMRQVAVIAKHNETNAVLANSTCSCTTEEVDSSNWLFPNMFIQYFIVIQKADNIFFLKEININ